MPCFARWVRGADQDITVTATDAASDLLFLVRETVDRSTQRRTRTSFSKQQLADGVRWNLVSNRRYKLEIIAHPSPASVATHIDIGGSTVFDQSCHSGGTPVAAFFRITVRNEG